MWSDELAQVAQTYAEQCVFQHNPDRISQQNTFSSVGENLFAGSGPADYEAAVQSWYDEVADYDYALNTCGAVCGHYTQVPKNLPCNSYGGAGREELPCPTAVLILLPHWVSNG